MKKKVISILILCNMFLVPDIYAKDVNSIIKDNESFFNYIDEIALNYNAGDSIILDPMRISFMNDVKASIIDQQAENEKTKEIMKLSLSDFANIYDELSAELDEKYAELEDVMLDFNNSVASFQQGEKLQVSEEELSELLINRVITIKMLTADILGKDAYDKDLIYQQIRTDYK